MDSGLTEIDLAGFTGQSPDHYSDPFVMEALDQAGDLLELATRIPTLPVEGSLLGRMARRGILAMAESIYEGNVYRELRHSPFRSETIGSYTYSIASESVMRGIPTGVSWFDLAVERLLEGSTSGISNSSVSAFDRPGDVVDVNGRPILVGPADTEDFRQGYPNGFGGTRQL